MIPLSDENPTRTVPYVTIGIIALNVLMFIYELSLGSQTELFIQACAFIPAELVTGVDIAPPSCVQPTFLTVFTSMFMHGGFLHIGSNMLYLWIFGNNVEDSMGGVKFLLFYLLAGLAATLTQTLITISFTPDQAGIPNLGASGAVAGVLGGYLVLFPSARVRTLVMLGVFWSIARIPALVVLGIWFLLQFLEGFGSISATAPEPAGVAFWAHIGGFAAGLVLIKLFARQERGRRAIPSLRF